MEPANSGRARFAQYYAEAEASAQKSHILNWRNTQGAVAVQRARGVVDKMCTGGVCVSGSVVRSLANVVHFITVRRSNRSAHYLPSEEGPPNMRIISSGNTPQAAAVEGAEKAGRSGWWQKWWRSLCAAVARESQSAGQAYGLPSCKVVR